MSDRGLWLKALLFNWVGGMSTLFGLLLSFLGWFIIPDTQHIRPYVKSVGVVALLWAAYRAWRTEHRQLLAAQAEITNIRQRPRLNPEEEENSRYVEQRLEKYSDGELQFLTWLAMNGPTAPAYYTASCVPGITIGEALGKARLDQIVKDDHDPQGGTRTTWISPQLVTAVRAYARRKTAP